MYHGTYRIAGQIVHIVSQHLYVQKYCRDYAVEVPEAEIACTIEIAQADIDYEAERSAAEDRLEGLPVHHYSDDYLETLAVYRKLAEWLVDKDTILFHGSVIAVDGVGYLFTAKSGTGKSTHTRLWRKHFGERAVMINDDKPLLRISREGVTVYGTPWDGKHHLSTNTEVPLQAICILTRDKENHIRRISKQEAYTMMIQQCYRSQDRMKMLSILQLLDRLAAKVGLYELGCNMDPEAAVVAYEGMRPEKAPIGEMK